MIELVFNELLRIKNIEIKEQYGTKAKEEYNQFVKSIKADNNVYLRRTKTLRDIASMLDVPVEFIISIMKYERIEDIEI